MTTNSRVHDVVAAEFDEYAVRARLRTSDRNTAYEVSADGRRAVCKTTVTQPGVLARESSVLETVGRRTPVPVPTMLAAGEGYLVMEWAEGEAYDDRANRPRRKAWLRAVGRELARLHRATPDWFDGHGVLEPTRGPLAVARPTDWPTRLVAFVEDWAADLRGTSDADVAEAVSEFVAEHRNAFADRPPVLIHGEPCPEHVRFEGDDFVALLDWEIAQAAPGAFDLVWAERDFLRIPAEEVDTELLSALHEGYETERTLSPGTAFRCEVYRAAFAMRDIAVVPDDRKASLRSYVFDCLDAAESIGVATDSNQFREE